MNRPKLEGLPRHTAERNWLRSFVYAWAGIAYAWRTQRNFRLEVIIGALAVVLGLVLRVNLSSILVMIALVLTLEMVNTALEALVDLSSPTYHPLAKIAKDVAAGAVLVASCISVIVGFVMFLAPLLRFFGFKT
jgi:diacylglycerol kinase (ATP)